MNVLIYGASNAIAVVIARIVRDSGHIPVMADSEKYSRAFFSRYCMKKYLVRDPLKDRAGFAADLARCIRNERITLVVPTTDEALLNLVESKEVVPGNVMVTFPLDIMKLRYVFDKANLPELCEKAGIKTPVTCPVCEGFEIENIEGLKAPFAIKRASGVAGEGFMRVDSRELLAHALATSKKEFPESGFLIQEYITGKVYGAGGVFDGETLRCFYSYELVRRHPRLSGPATVCRQQNLDSIKSAMEKVLTVIQWNGYCQMDFIVGEMNEQPYLIDINPVHWYSMPFSLSRDLSCLSFYIDKDKRRPELKRFPADAYTTLCVSRELQRIMAGVMFGKNSPDTGKEYWVCVRDLKRSDFYWDSFPVLLAPFLRVMRFFRACV